MKIHLVDGTYELFRAHFGAPPKQTADGLEIGATLGLIRSLMLLLSDPEVTHVAVAFDHVIESFRNKMYAGYKSSAGVDSVILNQFPIAEKIVSALGLVIWPMIKFEADDAIPAKSTLKPGIYYWRVKINGIYTPIQSTGWSFNTAP